MLFGVMKVVSSSAGVSALQGREVCWWSLVSRLGSCSKGSSMLSDGTTPAIRS